MNDMKRTRGDVSDEMGRQIDSGGAAGASSKRKGRRSSSGGSSDTEWVPIFSSKKL